MPVPCSIKIFIIVFIVISLIFSLRYKSNKKRRLNYLKNYHFPQNIHSEITRAYPHLENNEILEILNGLKIYFKLAIEANQHLVAMPSRVVDVAWHAFLLNTQEYQKFSQKTFGKFFHHIPNKKYNLNAIPESYKKIWVLSCLEEGISPDYPEKLPLLFNIDQKLKIEDGFIYPLTNNLGKDYSKGVFSASGCGGGGCGGC